MSICDPRQSSHVEESFAYTPELARMANTCLSGECAHSVRYMPDSMDHLSMDQRADIFAIVKAVYRIVCVVKGMPLVELRNACASN